MPLPQTPPFFRTDSLNLLKYLMGQNSLTALSDF